VMAEAARLTDYLWRDCCRARFTPAIPGKPGRVRNVLFLCAANSARSLMAEAILRHSAGRRFEAFSAGIDPRPEPDPQAMAMLRELRHETDALYSKPVTQFLEDEAPQMEFVITVCDRAASVDLAAWPGAPIAAHWPVPDPVELATPEAYAEAFLLLRARITALADLPSDMARPDLQRAVDRIAMLEAETG
jgi:ArsR family transcriptional regulator, arsenate/arsenite/antimonite-responsive transcriptional repressor / arsenate reductase (thioredoxin)